MTEGLLLGIAAALSWGVGDFLAAVAVRRVGTMRTAAIALLVGLLALAGFMALMGMAVPSDPAYWLRVAPIGVISSISALTFWQALRLGPLTVVSPIGSTVGAITVVLAVVLLGERPTPLQWAAVPCAAIGSALAAVVYTRGGGRPRLVGAGPIFAILAVVSFALVTVGLREPIREDGWAPAILVSRIANATVIWIIFAMVLVRARQAARRPGAQAILVPASAIIGVEAGVAPAALLSTADPSAEGPGHGSSRPSPPGTGPTRAGTSPPLTGRARVSRAMRGSDSLPETGPIDARSLALLIASGILGITAMCTLALGLEVAPAWLIGLVSSTGSVIMIAGGIVVYHERLRPLQWFGIALVGIALALVAIG